MPSETLLIDYIPSQILKAVPDKLSAVTDPENRVILTFEDPYVADEYLLTIKHGKNANYLTFRRNGEEDKKLINEAGSMISLILDPSFLRSQECIIPELNEEYRFAVQLRKYGTDLTNGEEIPSVVNDSKVSKELKYRVSAAWKSAPEITFASQTADGEITLKWDHEDYGVGCEYIVMRIRKVLGVMTGEEELGRTSDHAYKLNDLKNGKYCINIVPVLSGEKGTYSADADIDLKNEWVMAPDLACEQIGSNQVKLTWKAPPSMDQYHIIVYREDSHSLFRFINLAYKEYTHLDLEAAEGEMEYVFTYDEPIDPEHGIKLKFKIYGIRKTVSGEEQISATSSRTLIIK